MSLAVTCELCGARFNVSEELYQRKLAGKLVTLRCRQCQADIKIDASNPANPLPLSSRPPPLVVKQPPKPPRRADTKRELIALSPGLLPDAPAEPEMKADEEPPNAQSKSKILAALNVPPIPKKSDRPKTLGKPREEEDLSWSEAPPASEGPPSVPSLNELTKHAIDTPPALKGRGTTKVGLGGPAVGLSIKPVHPPTRAAKAPPPLPTDTPTPAPAVVPPKLPATATPLGPPKLPTTAATATPSPVLPPPLRATATPLDNKVAPPEFPEAPATPLAELEVDEPTVVRERAEGEAPPPIFPIDSAALLTPLPLDVVEPRPESQGTMEPTQVDTQPVAPAPTSRTRKHVIAPVSAETAKPQTSARGGQLRWIAGLGLAFAAGASLTFLRSPAHKPDPARAEVTTEVTPPQAPRVIDVPEPREPELSNVPDQRAETAPSQPQSDVLQTSPDKSKETPKANLATAPARQPAIATPKPPADTKPQVTESAPPESKTASSSKSAAPATTAVKPSSTRVPESAPAGGGGDFDKQAAVNALKAAAAEASSCRKPGDPSGMASVVITFAPSGRVTSATVSGPPFAGTATGGCIAATMRRARVPAFDGEKTTVSKTVVIN